ncbi:hypothetical protein KR084_011210 [Drosophila pseudotakahashii]|nr:hypothetical protein KR084_011210 [Drosophila pseudotakahashii]
MYLHFKFFVIIVILTIVRNSSANIPNCDYFDTVDISDLQRVNDTYIYQGLEIPSNLIAEYNYTELRYGSKEPVKTHLRACVCKVMPCVRICCPRKNMLANGTCFNKEITLNMTDITLEDLESNKIQNVGLINKYFRLRDKFEMCDKMLSLNEDDYGMLKDGTLILFNDMQLWPKQLYCLYPQFNLDFPNSIWVVKHNCIEKLLPASIEIIAISLIGYILTLFVYLYVGKLRNVLGKCIISNIFCLLIGDHFYILDRLNLLNRICLLAGYSRHFIVIATQLWYSVISFHLWKLLTNRSEHSSFPKYSAFAWGMAAFPTGVIYLVNLKPLVGYSGCSLEVWGLSFWIFLRGPELILTLFNIIMFVLTAIHIWKVKSELRKFKRDEERTIQCFNFDTETYLMFLRLSAIMGAVWILDFIHFLPDYSFFREVYTFVVYIEIGFGIVVFVLLICKRSTLKLLMER